MVTVAVADFVGSSTLVARTVAVVVPLTAYGEVYTPDAFTAPGPETIAQVTAVLSALLTVAVNCPVCEGDIAAGARGGVYGYCPWLAPSSRDNAKRPVRPRFPCGNE